jgi:alpha-tubulin suppressor-like RCC1 family protein
MPLWLLLGCGRIGFALNALQDGGAHSPDSSPRQQMPDAAIASTGVADAAAADGGGTDAGALDAGTVDPGSSHVTALLRGFGHMCFISDGSLSCWGSNGSGQLGLGDTQNRSVPTTLPGSWIGGCGGETYTCAIRQGGALFCWGDNSRGQLGLGDTTARREPTQLSGFSDWSAVSCIGAFTCAMRAGGALYCWGDNHEGSTAQNDAMGSPDVTTPQPIAVDARFSEISVGQGAACAIRLDGALFCWGRNTSSQLGLGDGSPAQQRSPTHVGDTDDWLTMGVGQEHTCGIRTDRSLWCWGSNTQLPLGFETAPDAKIKEPTRVGSMNNWRSVNASRLDTCAVTSEGAAYCWGRGAEGQLGNGGTDNKPVPTLVASDANWREVAVSWFYMCGRQNDDSVWCWGENGKGQLGLGDMMRRSKPVRVTFP